jgi:hypothetical protein
MTRIGSYIVYCLPAGGGGRELDHFGGQKGIWPAVVGGGRPREKWRVDGVAISLE